MRRKSATALSPSPSPFSTAAANSRVHNIHALFANPRAVADGGRRERDRVDSVYHAKNIVTLTAIYNGFRRRELLIVLREAYGPRRTRPPAPSPDLYFWFTGLLTPRNTVNNRTPAAIATFPSSPGSMDGRRQEFHVFGRQFPISYSRFIMRGHSRYKKTVRRDFH